MSAPQQPIADYGAIGNLRTVALVGRNGSIDWWCAPHLDSPAVFGAILDPEAGGRFSISIPGEPRGDQRYVPETNVLETTFTTEHGRLRVTDFMPLAGDLASHDSIAPPELHRIVEAPDGRVSAVVRWSPRFDFGRIVPRIQETSGGFIASSGAGRLSLGGVPAGAVVEVTEEASGPTVRATFDVGPSRRVALVARWEPERPDADPRTSDERLAETVAAWRAWSHGGEGEAFREWAGPWASLVARSELALKLLVFAGTGAIAAAPTTSLPEWIGGVRNWDYRYTWIRDASMTAQALIALGHRPEAVAFLDWAERVSEIHGTRRLRIMYGLRGETDLAEEELGHLAGFRGSRPVRIGNGAAAQRQLDIFGELLDGAFELVRYGDRPRDRMRAFLCELADEASAAVGERDSGIWEVRGPARVYTHSQAMLWVALDRAIALAGLGVLGGNVGRWKAGREAARRLVLEGGVDPQSGALVQAFGDTALDAATLRVPLHELLPFDDPRVQRTIDRVLAELTEDGLVYRYLADDGIPGREGAFLLCTNWLIDALAMSGRIDEALDLFDRLASRANHVGLLPEQIDPRTGTFLGNFPQAFSHLGLVNSAIYLAHAQGRPSPIAAPIGSARHRTSGR